MLHKKFPVKIFFLSVLIISLFSCSKRPEWEGCEFHIFSVKEYDVKLYAGFKKNMFYAVVAGDMEGIECSVVLKHACTASQFDEAISRLKDLTDNYYGTTNEIDLEKYPDLSAYVSLVLSYDDRREIWTSLGLEEDSD